MFLGLSRHMDGRREEHLHLKMRAGESYSSYGVRAATLSNVIKVCRTIVVCVVIVIFCIGKKSYTYL